MQRSAGWWLCSHLVRLKTAGGDHLQTANLEEIGAEEAVLAATEPWEPGAKVVLDARGFMAPAEVMRCEGRPTDFALRLRFLDGFRWSPELWRPDHLYRPEIKAKGAAKAWH